MSRKEKSSLAISKLTSFDPKAPTVRFSHSKGGVINPVPEQREERRPVNMIQSDLRVSGVKAVQDKPQPKSSMPNHLVNPFTFIQKVLTKTNEPIVLDHPDIWNPNTNSRFSTRKSKMFGSTMGHPADMAQSMRMSAVSQRFDTLGTETVDQDANKRFYELTRNVGDFAATFFSQIEQLMKEKKYRPHIKLETNPDPTFLQLFDEWAESKGIKFKQGNHPMVQGERPVSEHVFKNFILALGYPRDKEAEIQNFFNSFCQVKEQGRQVHKSLSIKAMNYNLRRFYEEREMVKNRLSEKAARQRNDDLKLYLQEWASNRDDFKLSVKLVKRDVGTVEDMIEQHLAQSTPSGDLGNAYKGESIRMLRLAHEKKHLMNLVVSHMDEDFLVVDNLLDSADRLAEEVLEKTAIRLDFVNLFSKEKKYFEEHSFNVLEIAQYLFDNRYTGMKYDVIVDFITSVKKYFNYSQGMDKDTPFPGKRTIPLAFLTSAIEIIRQKDELRNSIRTEFISKIQDFLMTHQRPEKDPQKRICEANYTAFVVQKFFMKLDMELGASTRRVQETNEYVLDNERPAYSVQRLAGDVFRILGYDPKKTMSPSQSMRSNPSIMVSPPDQDLQRPRSAGDKEIDDYMNLLNTGKSGWQRDEIKSNPDSNLVVMQGPDSLMNTGEKFFMSPRPRSAQRETQPLKSALKSTVRMSQVPLSHSIAEPKVHGFKTQTLGVPGETMALKSTMLDSTGHLNRSQVLIGSMNQLKTTHESPNFNVNQNPLKASVNQSLYMPAASKISKDFARATPGESKYEFLMPGDYYEYSAKKSIKDIPEGQWFLRPHHIETLTENPLSVKDNAADGHYQSFVRPLTEKEKGLIKRDPKYDNHRVLDKEEMISGIETSLLQLRASEEIAKQEYFARKQTEPARKELERGVKHLSSYVDASRGAKEYDLMANAYDGLMDEGRKGEKSVMLGKRDEEYDKVRPPKEGWYEMKKGGFTGEHERHLKILWETQADRDYRKSLQNKDLY